MDEGSYPECVAISCEEVNLECLGISGEGSYTGQDQLLQPPEVEKTTREFHLHDLPSCVNQCEK